MSYNPVIIIPGIGQSKVILADGNGNRIKNAWPVEIDTKAVIEELKGSLMKMMLFRKDAGFSDKIAAIVHDACQPLSLNADGTKKNNAIPVTYGRSVAECSENDRKFIYKMIPMESLGEKIGEDRLFYFAYDPFGDAYDTASRLDAFVASVKEQTGSEKVDFICVSLGGVVLRAYLDLFGSKNEVRKVVNIVSALDGSSLIADVFEDRLLLDDPASLLTSLGGKAASLASMAGMLPEEVTKNTIGKALRELKDSLIFNCTMMWGSIPVKRMDAILGKHPDMNDVLREKIVRLYDFSKNFPDAAKKLSADGMEFYQICGCGNTIFPVCLSKDVPADGIVDVTSASLGATSETADASPDASTCAFPENTWFFNSMSHEDAAYNDVLLSLVTDIITDGDTGVYPQFNGTRNIRKLRYELIPEAKNVVAEGRSVTELTKAIEDYEAILSQKVINDDNNVKELESRIKNLLDNS
jgi:hypothetical protein